MLARFKGAFVGEASSNNGTSNVIGSYLASVYGGWSTRYIRKLAAGGQIKAIKVSGRWVIDEASLEAFVEASKKREAESRR